MPTPQNWPKFFSVVCSTTCPVYLPAKPPYQFFPNLAFFRAVVLSRTAMTAGLAKASPESTTHYSTVFQSKIISGGFSLRDILSPPAATTTRPQTRPTPSRSYLCGLAPRRAVRGLPNASHGALPLSCCMSVRIFLSLSSKPAIGVRWCGRATCRKKESDKHGAQRGKPLEVSETCTGDEEYARRQ